jgi:hypothetical protein
LSQHSVRKLEEWRITTPEFEPHEGEVPLYSSFFRVLIWGAILQSVFETLPSP